MKENCKPFLPSRCKAWDILTDSKPTKQVHWSYLPSMEVRKRTTRKARLQSLYETI